MSTLFSKNLYKINQIAPLNHDFTEVLSTIALMPKTLYFYGKIPENVDGKRPFCVAIVGSRHSTKYGEKVAYELSYELAKRGAIIISGLATGIDATAHRAALDAGGRTVAVLGTAIDRLYPKINEPLAERILNQDGCIISEYEPGKFTDSRFCFLERNRLISGLSDAVIVAEAAFKSGAINTAAHAIEQGKDLFAVPGDIDHLTSAGCNKLLAQGASPITSVSDFVHQFYPEKRTKKSLPTGDSELETAILRAIFAGQSDGERLIAELKISVPIFNQTITMLEIKGRVQALGANHWALK